MKSRFAYLFLAASALVPHGAQKLQAADQVRAPVLGYVLDGETGSLHRLDGIPGAATVGGAIDVGVALARAEIALNGRFAIAWEEDGRILTVDLTNEAPVATLLREALEGADQALISPSGTRVALYASASGTLQFVDGLPHAARAGDTVELGPVRGEWTAVALSDLGTILAASSGEAGGAVFALAGDGPLMRIAAVRRASSIAFIAGGDDAVLADAAASEVILIRDAAGARHLRAVASGFDGVMNPTRVAATADGAFALATVAGGVATIPMLGGAPTVTECGCVPTALVPLASGSAFRLTDELAEPIQIVDVAPVFDVASASRMLFIPALQ